jgi:inhibitor of cysteine peptidase
MCRKLFLLTSFILLVTFGVTKLALGMPLPSGSLKVGTVIDIGKELVSSSSMYNPRSFGGKNYIVQINTPQRGVGYYPAGSAIYEALANIGDGAEPRMVGSFQAAEYILFSGGASNDYFSRIDPNLNLDTRVFATNLDVRPSSYDWVDDDTIIHNSYKSGLSANLYLTDINPDPFQVTANTSWNANGYVTTEATTRIRNVRMGDIYSGYAYYGDAGTENAGFWAIDLATGVSTQLGTLSVTGSGSWGLWTVKEVDGFLYVHTTHDGIYIYNMTDATTLGTLHTRYTKDKLDALAEDTNPNWGFDVMDDGARMLLSAGLGRVIEITDSRIADAPNPTSGAVDVRQTSILSWSPGEAAASHDVYFGTADAVKNADISSPEYKGSRNLDSESYDPGKLEWNTTYYWRVDEVEDGGTIQKGNLWSFTTADFLIVDDMELYNDINEDEPGSNRIYLAWLDGFDNPAINGSIVGYSIVPFVEQTIVHGGRQSMPFSYDNSVGKSEATLTLTYPRDWTENGVNTLVIWYIGDAANAAEPMYVVLNGNAVVNHDNPDAALATTWTEWNIDLQAFADQGVNLTSVTSITLGLGNRANPVAGGSGMVYFDDIRLYRPAPEPLPIEVHVDENGADSQVELEQGQILVVTLESNPTTGYRWEQAKNQESILEQMGEAEFKPSDTGEPPLVGAGGWEIFRFKAISAGRMTLQLVYHRSWEEGVEPLKTFSFQVVVP